MFEFVVLVEDYATPFGSVIKIVLQDEGEVRVVIDIPIDLEIENIPIVVERGTSPDQRLEIEISLQCLKLLWWLRTYSVVVVDVRSNLILLVLLSGLFWVDLAIRCNEPVARKLAFAVDMMDFKFQGPHIGKLDSC